MFVIVLVGCKRPASVSTDTPATLVPTMTIAAPTATFLPTPTPRPTATAALPAPTATQILVNWDLPVPPAINELPTELAARVIYLTPPEKCAETNDPNVSCSTKKGQLTDGDFVLKPNQAIIMTGDLITISKSGEVLVPVPDATVGHDLWSVFNATDSNINLHMYAPDGSFRGFFQVDQWNKDYITNIRDLHLYLFLLPTQTYDRFTPTPVPNCESKNGCDSVNVRVVIFDETGTHVVSYGLYQEATPYWQDLSVN